MIEGVQWIAGVFSKTPYVVLPCTKEEFAQKDKGGVMYTLPSDTFEEAQTSGRDIEWASKEKVVPKSVEEIHSTLETMIEYGVQVYFMSEETFRQIEASKDNSLSILRNLKSENQERGINIKTFLEAES
jgi:hypothetical protein